MTTLPDQRKEYLYGLDLLRVLASVLVLYTHVAHWFGTRQREWLPSEWVRNDVIAPLHLNPNLGFAGVCLFLLVSGLVVTHVGDRERPGQFIRRRLVRIVPLLFLTSFAAWLLVNLALYRPASGQSSLDVLDLFTGMTLAGFFTTPEVVFVGIAWTLLTQLVFYGYVAATMPILRRLPWLPSAMAAALCCLGLSFATNIHTVAPHRIGMIAAFVPVLCIGQLLSLVRAGKVTAPVGTALGTVHFMLFVWADRLGEYHQSGEAFPRTLLIMTAVVGLGMAWQGRVSSSRTIRAWAARTYAIYLLHPLCLYPIMDWLAPVLGQNVALVVALAVLAVAAELAYRYFERPLNTWFRTRERRSRGSPAPRS